MTSDEKQVAREVHERLLAARLATDENDDLARAAQIAAIAIPIHRRPAIMLASWYAWRSSGYRSASKKPGALQTANSS
jgi:hypothetical protein